MLKIATPISDLFEDQANIEKISALSDCFECRDKTLKSGIKNQEVFHCDLEPAHVLSDGEFEYLQSAAKAKKDLKLVTFHMASSCSRPLSVDGVYQVGGHKYSSQELLGNAKKNFQKIKGIFGHGVEIGIENNNYYPTEAYAWVTDGDFISRIVFENDIKLLFDIAHARISAHNKGVAYEAYKKALPMERTVQIHISDYGIGDDMAYDAHKLPGDDLLKEIEGLIPECGAVEYLTIEYYEDVDKLLGCLRKVRRMRNELY